MNKKILTIAAISFTTFVCACSPSSTSLPSHNDDSSLSLEAGASKAQLSPHEIIDLRQRALLGDGKSAERLALYYDMVALDVNQGRKWWQISAENGEESAYVNMAVVLSKSADPEDCLRTLFWSAKAIEKFQKSDPSRARIIEDLRRETIDRINGCKQKRAIKQ